MATSALIETLDPDTLIHEALKLMLATVPADFAAWVSVGEVHGQRVVRHVHYISNDTLPFDLKYIKGQPFFSGSSFDDHEDLLKQRQGRWSLSSPAPQNANKFAPFRQDYHREHVEHIHQEGTTTTVYERFYGPAEIGDQLRALIYQGRRALGWLGICRRGLRERFSAKERHALSTHINALQATILTVESQTTFNAADDIEHLVLDQQLNINAATPGALSWLNPKRLALLRAFFEARPTLHHPRCIEGTWVSVTPMLLAGHRQEYLVMLEPTQSVLLSPLHGLEPEVQQAALLLTQGFSVAQLATQLNIPERRARAHIRLLTRQFGAAELTQLAARIAQALNRL